jgi:hypothetical protein
VPRAPVLLAGLSIAALGSVAGLGCGSERSQTKAVATASCSAGCGGSGGAPALEVVLPQAVDGALFVNPTVYESVPLHVTTSPEATSVTVTLGVQPIVATHDGDGAWTATLPTQGLPDGVVPLVAEADAPSSVPATVDADLVVAAAGVELTRWQDDGYAGAPRIHRVGDALWLTYTDRAQPLAEAWLQRIDGGGRPMGDRVALVHADEETLYARAAFGTSGIGLLYQAHGSPYTTYFKVVDTQGNELCAPIALDPDGTFGSFGGDVAFDGQAYVAVWRVNDGNGGGQALWVRVDEATGTVTGPTVVASSGAGTAADPIGSFDPFSFVGVAVVGGRSLVSFVRGRYLPVLDYVVPKSQLALVQADGTLDWTAYAGIENDLSWHREARLARMGDRAVAVWSALDLGSPEDNPPNLFYGTETDPNGELDPERGAGVVMVDAPDDRDEPFLLEHPSEHAVLAWLDHRAYTLDPAFGRIALYVAPVDESLVSGDPVVFGHAEFYAGLGELTGALAGSNVPLTWLDTRHSVGLDAHFELWFDTAWF